uniref:DUF7748 domain-containing protein n=1 Tax=Physcomitrium patens TaxID=3218 RepID=A9SG94_PHYPA|nr:hypothetical protein PHYPA_010321 [Physcomitrium patens]
MVPIVIEFVSNTQQVLHVTVGNSRFRVNFSKIELGSKHSMQMDYIDTYQEYWIGPVRTESVLVLTSDDCCDFKSITIIEISGKFTAHKEPWVHYASEMLEAETAPLAEKGRTCSGRRRRIRLGLF